MNNSLIRLEHKLDLIIRALQANNLMITELPGLVGLEEDTCALCNASITLVVNPSEGILIRNCSCKLPKTAYKLDVTHPTKEATHADYRSENLEVPPDRAE